VTFLVTFAGKFKKMKKSVGGAITKQKCHTSVKKRGCDNQKNEPEISGLSWSSKIEIYADKVLFHLQGRVVLQEGGSPTE